MELTGNKWRALASIALLPLSYPNGLASLGIARIRFTEGIKYLGGRICLPPRLQPELVLHVTTVNHCYGLSPCHLWPVYFRTFTPCSVTPHHVCTYVVFIQELDRWGHSTLHLWGAYPASRPTEEFRTTAQVGLLDLPLL